MKGINITLCIALLGLISGILLCPVLNFSLLIEFIVFLSCFFSFLSLHFIFKRKHIYSVFIAFAAFLLFVFIGVLLVTLSDPLRKESHYTKTLAFEQPQTILLEIDEKLKPGFYDSKYVARVLLIQNKSASGKLIVNVEKDSAKPASDLRVGQYILTKTAAQKIAPPRNPFQFDYKAYLKERGIFAAITVSKQELLQLPYSKNSPQSFADHLRASLNAKLDRFTMHPDNRAVLNALVLGQRQELSTDLQNDYANAGVIHILAVSGLHVGILMLIVHFLLKPLGNYWHSRIPKTLIVLLVIWGFALITGFSPSVLRAATMFSFIQVGFFFNQRKAGFNALIASAFVLLAIRPRLLFEVGFQLSYAAVFAILWLYPKFEKLGLPKNKLLQYYWKIILVSLAAQIGVLPLSLFYFHQFPGVFLIANCVVLPFLGFILIYGLILLTAAALNLLPEFAVECYDLILTWLNIFIKGLASLDVFLIENIYFSLPLVILSYLLIFSAENFSQRFSFKNISLLLLVLISFPITLLFSQFAQRQPKFYILHQYQTSLFSYQNEQLEFTFYTESNREPPQQLLNQFKTHQQVAAVQAAKLKHFYQIKEQTIFRIDSSAVFEIPKLEPDIIVLTQSPKVNLDRLTERYPNAVYIADGSNYKSYVARWEATCTKKKIPFHNTYEKGFYKIE